MKTCKFYSTNLKNTGPKEISLQKLPPHVDQIYIDTIDEHSCDIKFPKGNVEFPFLWESKKGENKIKEVFFFARGCVDCHDPNIYYNNH